MRAGQGRSALDRPLEALLLDLGRLRRLGRAARFWLGLFTGYTFTVFTISTISIAAQVARSIHLSGATR